MNTDEVDALAEKLYEYGQLHQTALPSDVIIALGNLDLRIAEKAADLWHQQLAPIVVATGGIGRLTPKDWMEPEAVKFAAVLQAAGVPSNNILVEDQSTNIPENISLTVKLLEANDQRPKRLILVALPFAERRILALCEKQFPEFDIRMASAETSYKDFMNKDIDRSQAINLIVGETDRLEKFPAKGFSVAQPIPQEILSAKAQLIEAGFDMYKVI